MTRLFTSTGYIDRQDEPNAELMKTLPSFLRVLLATDGTVTKSLEAFFWEPIAVQNHGQGYLQLEADAPVINRSAGDTVLRRSVQLQGRHSGSRYASAVSLICTEMLSTSLTTRLEAGRMGIGELLRDCGLETYREVVAIGRGGDNPDSDEASVWRTYRIVTDHKPFIQITEFFPLSIYWDADTVDTQG